MHGDDLDERSSQYHKVEQQTDHSQEAGLGAWWLGVGLVSQPPATSLSIRHEQNHNISACSGRHVSATGCKLTQVSRKTITKTCLSSHASS